MRQLRRFAALFLALCLLLCADAPEAEALWRKKGAKQQEPQSSPSSNINMQMKTNFFMIFPFYIK